MYFVAPQKLKNAVLFLGSLFFCAYGSGILSLILLANILLDYFCGRFLGHEKQKKASVLYLIISVVSHLVGMYYANLIFGATYFTAMYYIYHLMAVSYIADCFRKKITPQGNLIDYGAYVFFFPVMMAGPVLRYQEVEERLKTRKVSILEIQNGVKKLIRGLAKKVLLAGHLYLMWENICKIDPKYLTTAHAWIGAVVLSMYYYYVLSGHADMAIGLAEILGFQIPENFNYPLLARSVTEFFNKYCITIVQWFRDYVYAFIGGSKEKSIQKIPAILAMWFAIGLFLQRGTQGILVAMWFAIWLIIEDLFFGKVLKLLPSIARFCYTHAVIVLGLLVFTMSSLDNAARYLEQMFCIGNFNIYNNSVLYFLLKNVVWLVLSVLAALPIFHKLTLNMKNATTGGQVGFYRIMDKLIPASLLVLSLIYLGKI